MLLNFSVSVTTETLSAQIACIWLLCLKSRQANFTYLICLRGLEQLLKKCFLRQDWRFLCWNIFKSSKICRLLHGCDFVARANIHHSLPRSLIHHRPITQWTSTRTIITVAPTADELCRLEGREMREDCKKKRQAVKTARNYQSFGRISIESSCACH